MASTDLPSVSVAVVPRDRYSTIAAAARHARATVAPDVDVFVVAGDLPRPIAAELEAIDGVEPVLVDRRVHGMAARNVALERATTDLLAFVEGDSFPRADWLEPLVTRQADTGAGVVAPLILERPTTIHCAGTMLYVDVVDGRRQGWKVLVANGKPYHDGCELQPGKCDYVELHTHVVDAAAMRSVGGFSEELIEAGEIDHCLDLAAAGYEAWFEPAAVTFFHLDGPITKHDIGFFTEKWDAQTLLRSYRWFEQKWGIDIREGRDFQEFVGFMNGQVPWLARVTGSEWGLRVGRAARAASVRAAWSGPAVLQRIRRRRWAPTWLEDPPFDG